MLYRLEISSARQLSLVLLDLTSLRSLGYEQNVDRFFAGLGPCQDLARVLVTLLKPSELIIFTVYMLSVSWSSKLLPVPPTYTLPTESQSSPDSSSFLPRLRIHKAGFLTSTTPLLGTDFLYQLSFLVLLLITQEGTDRAKGFILSHGLRGYSSP